jgi:hypothetical protein
VSANVPFHWIEARLLVKGGKGFLGVCGKSRRVAKVGGTLEAVVIRDLFITEGGCEEEARCLDVECPLNKTTPDSLRKSMGLSKRCKLPDLNEPLAVNLAPEVLDFCASVCDEHPDSGVLVGRGEPAEIASRKAVKA